MIDFFLSGDNIPFTVAIVLMLAIAVLEGVTSVMGMGISNLLDSILPDLDLDVDIDADVDVDVDTDIDINTGPSIFTKFLSWIQVGKVPLLVLLIAGLTVFGIAGFFVQSASKFFIGGYLPWFIAIFPALIISMPVIRVSAKILSKIIPDDDTSAVSQDSFIGQIATITLGKAEKGKPAEAKLKDKFGQTHYLMIEPDKENDIFRQSEQVLIVSRNGSVYKAIKNTNILLSDN